MSPSLNNTEDKSLAQKTNNLSKSFLVLFSLVLLVIIFTNLVCQFIDNLCHSSIYNIIHKQQSKVLFKDDFSYNIFYILLLGPVIEEVIFRLPLKPSKINLIVSLSFLCMLFMGGHISNIFYFNFNFLYKFLSIFFVIVFVIFLNQSFLYKIENKWYGLYFYFLCSTFALIHIENFYHVLPINFIYLSPLFVVPQFLLGCFAGYIRVKNGVLWSVFLHVLFNIPTTLIYIFTNLL